MKVLVVAGARPNFMKVAPILRELEKRGHESELVHTGQHFDAQMSDAFFSDLQLPQPHFHLGVGGGSHASQTARIMESFEPVLERSSPNWLLVVGDVNSTLAASLVASKLKEQTGSRTVHVEAGLRSGDWRMPEEVNRVLTDRLSDLLLTPSRDALPNLLQENIAESAIEFVGNVMIDTLYGALPAARAMAAFDRLNLRAGEFVVATLHRPSNVDNKERLGSILEGLVAVSRRVPVALPLHPRTRNRIREFGMERLLEPLIVLEPLGYRAMLSLTDGAAVVLTDSGGLQEETTVLGVPCITLRETTERPATITHGTNRMLPWPPTPVGILRAFEDARECGRLAIGSRVPEGWDGRASERVCDALENHL